MGCFYLTILVDLLRPPRNPPFSGSVAPACFIRFDWGGGFSAASFTLLRSCLAQCHDSLNSRNSLCCRTAHTSRRRQSRRLPLPMSRSHKFDHAGAPLQTPGHTHRSAVSMTVENIEMCACFASRRIVRPPQIKLRRRLEGCNDYDLQLNGITECSRSIEN